VQRYAWGDTQFLPTLLGVEPDGEPWAELWLGTHPSGPATLDDGRPLANVAGQLPYLLKVLAAAEPLSLQVHPNAEQARQGFDRGIYADPHPKPELLCALTEFDALCGIRPVDATLALLEELGARELASTLAASGPGGALAALYTGTIDSRPVIDACERSERAEATVASQLAGRYPDDPSVVVTLLLNHVRLAPGEALQLGAGNRHAYLRGAGIELMGPSDNVVRAGLTEKPVDVDELLRIADPTPLVDPVMAPTARYRLDGGGVALVHLRPGDTHRAVGHELSIDLTGEAWYQGPGDQRTVTANTYIVTPCVVTP
jgi:mannose-6-phosphate isomerase